MKYEELDSSDKSVVELVAKEYGVAPLALWECYLEVQESNFEQDLDDIARENEEYLKAKQEVACE